MIDFLLSKHPAAVYILEHCVVKIVPMLNIDGVVEGFYRIGLSGCDLNRVWERPDPAFHPVVSRTKQLLKQLSTEKNVACYLDFHGHSRLNGTFIFGCPNVEEGEERDSEKRLPRMLSFLSDAFSWGHCVFSFPRERRAASRIVARKELGIVHSFTLETSFGGIVDGPRAGALYDEIIWKEIGAKCGEALYHLLVGRESPLSNYVDREIGLLNPPVESNEEDCSQIHILECRTEGRGDCGPLKKGRLPATPGNKFWWMSAPKSFLTANWRIISSEAPGYLAPKWKQMQFSLE
jgi:hypothetical protein